MDVRFDIPDRHRRLIRRIVNRAAGAGLVKGKVAPDHWYDRLHCTMDLTATHRNGCPLDLERLLDSNGVDFVHDIAGIARHLDRNTGRLGGCFLPRCARPPRRRAA